MKRFWPGFELRITLFYIVGGGLWILFTDRLLAAFITDVKTLTVFQTYKGLLYVSFSALLIFLLLRHHVHRWRIAEHEWRESEKRYSQVVERANDGIMIIQDNKITYANPQLAKLLGYSSVDEFLKTPPSSYIPPDEFPILREQYNRRMRGEPVPSIFDVELIRKDGSTIYTEFNAGIIPYEGKPADLIFVRDITERKKTELQLQKLNRTLRILTKINQTILHAQDPQSLFESACQIAVDEGNFQMAWIGQLDPKTKGVIPVASAGKVGQYLEKLNITLDESPRGQGPTATALRTRKPVVVNDIATDPRMRPWRKEALRLGYRASGAFPLLVKEKLYGTLNLYAKQPGFFEEEEIQLLEELAQDIAFALEYLEQEKERKKAERKTKEHLEELKKWHEVTLGRETRIIQLKQEVNELLKRLGEPIRYPSIEKDTS